MHARTYGAQYARKVGAMVHLPVNVVLVQAIGNAHVSDTGVGYLRILRSPSLSSITASPPAMHEGLAGVTDRLSHGWTCSRMRAEMSTPLRHILGEFLARTSEGAAPGTLRTYGMRHACIATNEENADLERRADIVADAISGAASDP